MRRAAECGARLHLAHPLGIAGYENRRVKNDLRDATLLADLLRLGRLPGAWVAPREVRELREMVRYRAKLGRLRSGLKAQVHQTVSRRRSTSWIWPSPDNASAPTPLSHQSPESNPDPRAEGVR